MQTRSVKTAEDAAALIAERAIDNVKISAFDVRAAHFADPGLGKAFDLQRADAGAVVRAGARAPILRDGA